MARSLVVVALVAVLFILDPVLALLIVVILGGSYGTIYVAMRTKQRQLGRDVMTANNARFKAFGGIKDVKVLQREQAFVDQFSPASWTFSRAMASNRTVSQLPRYLLEAIAFGGVVLIVLYYLHAGRGVAQILPVLSLYALAGYRLMPELPQLFHGITQIRFNRAALDDLLDDMGTMKTETTIDSSAAPLPFEKAITVENVLFFLIVIIRLLPGLI